MTDPDSRPGPVSFDADRLDRLMEADNLDAVILCSKHNVQYLTGGYRYFFYEHAPFIGVNRYLPLAVYSKGRPAEVAYIGNRGERDAIGNAKAEGRFRMPVVLPVSYGTRDSMLAAVQHLRSIGASLRRIGIEPNALPFDAHAVLRDGLPDCEIADAAPALDRLRARKTPGELGRLRHASEGVVAAMLATLARCGAGSSKREIIRALREEETRRGLDFEYCLVTLGASHNRAPSDEVWRAGDILSIDSGAHYDGYIGDLCRMGILGEPDSELEDLLAEVDRIQQLARSPVRHGVQGGEIYAAVRPALASSSQAANMAFVAHGMGLVSHELPRLTDKGPVPYAGSDAERPLESGMVLSIETTIHHPRRGFIKLEDTIVVTDEGHEALGDDGRGWNRAGSPNPEQPRTTP